MKCKNCAVPIRLLKDVEGEPVWVHSEPGDPPYIYCKRLRAKPDTVGAWATRLLDVRR